MANKKPVKMRMLTIQEVEILNFLWRWKLSNYMTLKMSVAPLRSHWKFYQILRRLFNEGYIREVMDGSLQIPLWTLTKKGYSAVSEGLGTIEQERYQPQSVAHDFIASVFHLGDFVLGVPDGVELLSEQEITAKHIELLPDWVPKSKTHIPDGYSRLKTSKGKMTLAFEVELSQKEMVRYEEMIAFLDQNDSIDLVLWLCRTESLIQKITQQIVKTKRWRMFIHNFVLLQDFQNQGWQSPILWGGHANQTVRDLMGQYPMQSGVNKPILADLPTAHSFLFSKIKSPKGLIA